MTNLSFLARAIALAAAAHDRQLDKAGAPYILHPIRMMMRARTEDERIVALLHDVVEDSELTLDALRLEGFPEHIVSAVDAMTHREGESYDEFVDRAAADPIAKNVKILDLEDNMDTTRLEHVTDRDVERLNKYRATHQKLTLIG